MSELGAYIQRSKKSQREAADELDITPAFLSQLLSGVRRPSGDLAFRIEEWSGGAVKAKSWFAEKPRCA